MPIIRSYGPNGQYEMVDYTGEIVTIPNQWGLINSLGLFEEQGVAELNVQFEKREVNAAILVDRVRGERSTVNKDNLRSIHAFAIPHFNLDDYITPADLSGKRAYNGDKVDTLAEVRARKLERIRMSYAWTTEFARAKLLTSGEVYAPNGTVNYNWYDVFGVTRKEVDFALGTPGTEITDKIEEVIAHIQDTLTNGSLATGIIALCSPEFFSKLIKHAKVVSAYTYYSSTQEPLRQRLGGPDALHRRFVHGGIEFIEYRGSYDGQRLIPAGDAYFLPQGVSDVYATYFAPAQKFDIVNTVGEQVYAFEYADPRGEKYEIETESNFLNMLKRPQVVVRAHSSN